MESFKLTDVFTEKDRVKFQEEKDRILKAFKVHYWSVHINLVPAGVDRNGGVGMIAVYMLYFERECSKQEFASWKFGSQIMKP